MSLQVKNNIKISAVIAACVAPLVFACAFISYATPIIYSVVNAK